MRVAEAEVKQLANPPSRRMRAPVRGLSPSLRAVRAISIRR